MQAALCWGSDSPAPWQGCGTSPSCAGVGGRWVGGSGGQQTRAPKSQEFAKVRGWVSGTR